MKKKVRCKNCDAVLEAEEKRFYMSMKWWYEYRCYHCNSVRTVATDEPYRLPKWERGLTKRTLDAGDSAAFSSIFLASSFSCSQIESTPTHLPVTQTVGQILCKRNKP